MNTLSDDDDDSDHDDNNSLDCVPVDLARILIPKDEAGGRVPIGPGLEVLVRLGQHSVALNGPYNSDLSSKEPRVFKPQNLLFWQTGDIKTMYVKKLNAFQFPCQ